MWGAWSIAPKLTLKDITYSIVIPAYNEGKRLGATLEKVLGYVREQGWNAEVVVVNDGSRDNTAELVRAFSAKDSTLRLIENPGNRGKGYAVRNGMLNARGEEGEVVIEAIAVGALGEQPRRITPALKAGPVPLLVGDGPQGPARLGAPGVEGGVDVDQLEGAIGEAWQDLEAVAEQDLLSSWGL